eukprot:scaffold83_cov246-Pinguiococcus_pyrenoidosus.AAC.5
MLLRTGANAFNDHDILFDVEGSRVGIVPSSCDPQVPLDARPPYQRLLGKAKPSFFQKFVLSHSVFGWFFELMTGFQAKPSGGKIVNDVGQGKLDRASGQSFSKKMDEQSRFLTILILSLICCGAFLVYVWRKAMAEVKLHQVKMTKSRSRENSKEAEDPQADCNEALAGNKEPGNSSPRFAEQRRKDLWDKGSPVPDTSPIQDGEAKNNHPARERLKKVTQKA